MLPLLVLPVRQMIFLSQSRLIQTIDSTSGRLERMVFTVHDFERLNFTRADREFIYNGNMYDVHSILKSGEQIIVIAIWDKPETDLLMAFQSHDDTCKPMPGTVKIGFLPYFHLIPDCYNIQVNRPVLCQFGIALQKYADPFMGNSYPPPELLG